MEPSIFLEFFKNTSFPDDFIMTRTIYRFFHFLSLSLSFSPSLARICENTFLFILFFFSFRRNKNCNYLYTCGRLGILARTFGVAKHQCELTRLNWRYVFFFSLTLKYVWLLAVRHYTSAFPNFSFLSNNLDVILCTAYRFFKILQMLYNRN